MSQKWQFQACVLGAALLGVVAGGQTVRVGAQEGAGLFTAPPVAHDTDLARPQAMGEVRSRAVGIDVSRLPASVAADRADRLTLNLFEDVQLVAEIDRIDTTGSANIFIGHVEGLTGGDNSVTLVVADGVMMGSINAAGRHFQVRFNGGSHVVREVNPGAFPDETDPTPSATLGPAVDNKEIPGRAADAALMAATPVTGPPPTGGAARDAAVAADPGGGAADTGDRTDVMVLYTATARAAAGGTAAIQNLITLGVTETNTAYANSGIGTRMRLVHMREVAYAESGDALTDRNRLFNGADGQLDEVHGWRNTYGADMVQMLVDNAGAGSCGIAYLNGPEASMAAQSAFAYAVTYWECVSPNYTFAHEFGHIQGANHAPDDPTGTGAYSYSFGFKRCATTPYFRSVMAYACTSGATGTARSLYFSNPAVNFGGAPTGTATQNNGLTLHNTRTIIGNFRAEQPLVQVTSLWPPADAADLRVGQTTRLWAYVVNNSPYPLSANAGVWFWTDGPGTSTGEGWVGSATVTGLAPGSGAWYYSDVTIPNDAAPGAWVYWARVWDGAAAEYLSDWRGPQGFTVLSVQGTVQSLWPVPVTTAGNTATLWGLVQNTGTGAFPTGTVLRYWVSGPGFSDYVGSVPVAGLAPGGTAWYSFNWAIPATRTPGAHNYWAILEYTSAGLTRNISAWQGPQAFTVTAAPADSANIDSLWTVGQPTGGAPQRGLPVRLWGLVRNNGLNVHDANTHAYFWVTGPGIDQYVCSQTTDGLASGASAWRWCDWTIPAGATLGAYSYRAIVWKWTGTAWQQISAWSTTQAFDVASDQALSAPAHAPGKR